MKMSSDYEEYYQPHRIDMNRGIRLLLILGLLLTTTHRLPAPISEIPEPSATATPKAKSKPPAMAKTQNTSTEKTHAADELSAKTKTATPRVLKNTRTEKAKPSPVPTQRTVSGQLSQFPTAKPIPGKPGFVFSPFVSDPESGYVDVRGFVQAPR